MSNPTNITADPGVPFVDTVREFDAPVDAVYRAHVEPELMVQWLGPREDKQSGSGRPLSPVRGKQTYSIVRREQRLM